VGTLFVKVVPEGIVEALKCHSELQNQNRVIEDRQRRDG
jgi:hypothetical protein